MLVKNKTLKVSSFYFNLWKNSKKTAEKETQESQTQVTFIKIDL
jgi:hypothetical protein